MLTFSGLLLAFVVAPLNGLAWSAAWRRLGRPGPRGDWLLYWNGGGVGVAIAALAARHFGDVTAGAVSALLAFILWWWRRKKNRLRALRLIGAKARARLAALIRSMPRPAPRLVPEGVPA